MDCSDKKRLTIVMGSCIITTMVSRYLARIPRDESLILMYPGRPVHNMGFLVSEISTGESQGHSKEQREKQGQCSFHSQSDKSLALTRALHPWCAAHGYSPTDLGWSWGVGGLDCRGIMGDRR